MPRGEQGKDIPAAIGPRSLWEAVTMLSRIQDQQEVAIKERDLARMNRLLSEQAVAWSYVRGFAEQLVRRGEAPPGMARRLRTVLKIHERREVELAEALARLGEKLQSAA